MVALPHNGYDHPIVHQQLLPQLVHSVNRALRCIRLGSVGEAEVGGVVDAEVLEDMDHLVNSLHEQVCAHDCIFTVYHFFLVTEETASLDVHI